MLLQELCTELLHHIFVLSTEESPIHSTSPNNFHYAPCWMLSTCRRWRSLALATPKLWRDINIDLDLNRASKIPPTAVYPIHKIFLLLRRSKSTGLRISFRCPSSSTDVVGNRYALEILDILSRHRERWKEVRIQFPNVSFLDSRYWNHPELSDLAGFQGELLGRLLVGKFPVLSSVKISGQGALNRRQRRQKKSILRVDVDSTLLTTVDVENIEGSLSFRGAFASRTENGKIRWER